MTKSCIICGSSVLVVGNPEIVACDNEHCQRVIEDCIGLHYETGPRRATMSQIEFEREYFQTPTPGDGMPMSQYIKANNENTRNRHA